MVTDLVRAVISCQYVFRSLPLFLSLQGYLVLHQNLDKGHLFEPKLKNK